MKRVVLAVALALSLVALAGPVAAHGLPQPGWGLVADAACDNPGTPGLFLTASFAVPMDGTNFDEPWCMTMNSSWRTALEIVGPPGQNR
jgi:hypothetical protein